jgi:5-methyltetrahydrofolate--homocysteine methyltransferase
MAHDESGIANNPQQRLAAARKIFERARDYGIPPQDVLIDPLVLTVGADHGAASVTLETARLVRQELDVNLSIGASNISFGLPDRTPINAAFLVLAMGAGVTAAITNPLEPELRKAILAADLLLGRDPYAARWIKTFRALQKAG